VEGEKFFLPLQPGSAYVVVMIPYGYSFSFLSMQFRTVRWRADPDMLTTMTLCMPNPFTSLCA